MRDGDATAPFRQVVGDAVAHQLKRQLAAVDATIEPDDMEAIAGFDRLLRHLTRREAVERFLEFRRCIARSDLPQITARLA